MSETEIECVKIYLSSSGNISIYCLICKSSLNNRCKLFRHIQAHFSTIPFECHLCDNTYANFAKLIFHIKDDHKIHQKINFEEEINDCNAENIHENNTVTTTMHDTLGPGEQYLELEPEIILFDETDIHKYDLETSDEINEEDTLCSLENTSVYSMENGNQLKEESFEVITLVNDVDNNEGDDLIMNSEYEADTINTNSDKQQSYDRNTDEKLTIKKSNKLFICDTCGKSFTQKSGLVVHLQLHLDPMDGKCVCDICDRMFTSAGYLKVHLRSHNNDFPFECRVCHKKFITKSALATHLRMHLSMKPYNCNIMHNDDEQEKYEESEPKKKSTSRKKKHQPKNKYICDICGKSYLQIRSLQEHLQSHIDPNERKCICNICHKRFNSEGYLKVHLRFHNNDRPYKCEYCPKQFVTNSTWRSHTRIHLNIKPYNCDVCNKQFKDSNTLREHNRIHTGEKPYNCDLCCLKFRTRDILRNHRRIHTGEKPYGCKICHESFSSNAAVFGHMKSRHKNI